VIRLGDADPESDADHGFLFPPNRGPRARWRALCRALREANTWVTVAYSVIWTLALIYLAARLTDTPPWSIRYWEANGVRIAVAIGGSLALLAAGYVAWEAYQFVRDRAGEWRFGLREWHQRWFGGHRLVLDETARLEAISTSPLLRTLPPPQRQQLLQAMQVTRHGPWRTLPGYAGGEASQVALIVSGRVGLRRHLSSGRRVRTQVLESGDVIGLHDLADPTGRAFDLRTLTPVTLLALPRPKAAEIFVQRVGAVTLHNIILKLPFLRSISLCENWHQQAIERFATLSNVVAEPDGDVIFVEGLIADRFFIIFEGEAVVSRAGKRLAVVRAGEFFGEIGMMQMSPASATITTRGETRCLAIARQEFMRFVTHNYSVALEIERVSSRRLRHPLFPLTPGDFRAT
jgi:CRP-like cAMP-binding protein